MRYSFSLITLVLLILLPAGAVAQTTQEPAPPYTLLSPSGELSLTFALFDGHAVYSVKRKDVVVLDPSRLGVRLKGSDNLAESLTLISTNRRQVDETWEQLWGERRYARNHYNELALTLTGGGESPQQMIVVFRAFDDGIAFRYEWPKQPHLGTFSITDELTEFAIAGGGLAWWIPAYGASRYEYLYRRSPIANLGAVHTPLTIEVSHGLYLSIHEAALTDYASMTLMANGSTTLACDLVPWADGDKVKAVAPFVSPWRTIQIAASPGELITSDLVLNLNEPCQIEDTSWIKPGKYVGIWWGMHLNNWTWSSGPQHGATTERTKRYIDFAADNGFDGVLVEGWNVGWDGNWIANGDQFSFTRPYPDFDLEALARYAAEHGVTLIGHHETAYGIANYERQLEEAFTLYERLGVKAVKTGYVDNVAELDELHHGQFMVRHYRKVVETAARHKIMVDVHEPIKDTGIRRTWPNMMTREGARGMEYNAWSADGGNPPEHETILPFTRGLAGPFDFTPGIVDLTLASRAQSTPPVARVNTTLAKALASYIVIYSPLHMAADLIENYEGQPAFAFITAVPTDWQETIVLGGVIGDFVTIARKDRHSDDWYIGSVSDEFARSFDISLSFLDPGREYLARIYSDAHDADWQSRPDKLAITEQAVTSTTVLPVRLAQGGGLAMRISPAP